MLLWLSLLVIVMQIPADIVYGEEPKTRGYGKLPESKLFREETSYTDIQPLIDATPPNGELLLEAGHYIGPLTVSQPIRISGQGADTILHITEEGQTIVLDASFIELKHMVISDERDEPIAPVIASSQQQGLTMENLQIKTMATAFEWMEIKQSRIVDTEIVWNGKPSVRRSARGNGIYLHSSDDIAFLRNSIQGMYDGIYSESSERLVMRENTVRNSRYAYHLMYAKQADITDNTSKGNIVGLMIMTSDNVVLQRNQLTNHQDNANAGGILIYDVLNAEISYNNVAKNRIGINIERSESIKVHHNVLQHNFVSLQLQRTDELFIEHNDFVSNVTNVWDDGSSKPTIQYNYWDTLQGLDYNGDGYSELTYSSAPFFLALIERRPSFQLLFGTPGIAFIEELYSAQREQWNADLFPSMVMNRPATDEASRLRWGMLLSWLMAGAAAVYMMIKMRREEG